MFDKDEISDAEYEKLLREDMDEEEFEEMKAKENGGDKEGEEEEESPCRKPGCVLTWAWGGSPSSWLAGVNIISLRMRVRGDEGTPNDPFL